MKTKELTPSFKLKAPKIITMDNKQVIYVRLTGAFEQLDFPGAYTKLWNCVKANKLFTAGIESVAIYHDDPKVTEGSKLRSDVCLVVHKPVRAQGEIGVKEIQGGRYAVFLYEGPYPDLGQAYDAIFSEWLPASGCALRNIPMFEKYCNNPEKTAPEKLKTEIYVPIV